MIIVKITPGLLTTVLFEMEDTFLNHVLFSIKKRFQSLICCIALLKSFAGAPPVVNKFTIRLLYFNKFVYNSITPLIYNIYEVCFS